MTVINSGNVIDQMQNLLDWGNASDYSSIKFSPQENFQLKAEWYSNLWQTDLSKVYWDLANNLWQYSWYANETVSAYNNLLNYMANNERWLQELAGNTYNKLVDDINSQRNYVNSIFWPEWKLTKEIDTYYDDLWNYLSTDAGRQAAKIAAQGLHSWASLWAIRAQQNEAYNESFWRYVQAKEQQINAKTNVATNLINFMSTLRKEYWDSTNQYIIELYKRAVDLYNNTALSLWQDLNNLNKLRMASGWGSSWWSSLNDLLSALWYLDGDDSASSSKNTVVKWEWSQWEWSQWGWGSKLWNAVTWKVNWLGLAYPTVYAFKKALDSGLDIRANLSWKGNSKK